MSLELNNNSLHTKHFYENLFNLYRTVRTSSDKPAQDLLSDLSISFQKSIIDQLDRMNAGFYLRKKNWDKTKIFNDVSTAPLQHAIQGIALLGVQELLRHHDENQSDEKINWLCKEGIAQNLTEAYLICLHDYGQDKALEAILDMWVAEGDSEECREVAKEKILQFRRDPTTASLFLDRLNLKTLPSIFHLQPFRDRLDALYLSDNQLQTLPSEISHLRNLGYLFLSDNQFSEFPKEICELKKLRSLDIARNPLLKLPENISNLKELKYLSATETLLTECPEVVFRLSKDCTVDFYATLLSDRDIQKIQATLCSPSYQGPLSLFYNQKKEGSLFELNQFLRNFFPDYRLALSDFPDLVNDPKTHRAFSEWPQQIFPNKHHILTEWLRRVSWSRDYETPSSRSNTIDRVANAMEHAQSDPLYREKFWEITGEATTDCGDRGALSLLRLGRWRRVFLSINPQDIKAFAQVIASIWPLEMLDRIAAYKIERIRKNDSKFREDTQVFLEYPLKLKANLNLDIDVEANYFSVYSKVTPDELNQAEAFVQRLEPNQRERCRFLFNETLWFDAFTKAYPEEIKGIEDYIEWKMDKLDGNENSTKEDYDTVQKLREELFIALIAFKLSLEIPELPLEEIIDWETDLHNTFGIVENVSNSISPAMEQDPAQFTDPYDALSETPPPSDLEIFSDSEDVGGEE